MLAKTNKKILAMFLTLCMVVGLVPITATASNDLYSNRVTKQGTTSYFDEDGKQGSESDHAVSISKTIAATGVENQFDIKLEVNAKDRIIETETVVGADIVLVFDVSTSMDDNGRWQNLKAAADSFINSMLTKDSKNRISIVVYGGSNSGSKSTNHATLCEFSNDAEQVKSTYSKYNYVSQSNTNGTSLRKAVFGDDNTYYGATNCQAGFWAADEMLDSARAEALKYTVYMSDGATNRIYKEGEKTLDCDHNHSTKCCDSKSHWHDCNANKCSHKHDDDCYDVETSKSYVTSISSGKTLVAPDNENSTSVAAAKAQATLLKKNHADSKILTIGFGTGSNSVLSPAGDNGNKAVDEFHEGTTANITSIYDKISKQITLETNPWMVYDPMSDYVNIVPDSIIGEKFAIDQEGTRIVWDLAEIVKENAGKKDFILTYTVKIDMNNPLAWESNTSHPTNGTTKLVYKVVSSNGGSNISHNAVTVNFDLPEVNSALYNVKVEHYIDNVKASEKTFKQLGGYEINLDGEKLNRTNVTYTGRSIGTTDISNVDTFTIVSEKNNTVIRYDYKTGYPLIINYKEQGTNTTLNTSYKGTFKNTESYSVNSPIIAGYHLVNNNQATVAGNMPNSSRSIDVFYAKTEYSVTYLFEGNAPSEITAPTDTKKYYYNDELTVKTNPSCEGWTFNGWNKSTGYKITGDTVVAGTWTINSYGLDVIYQFLNSDEYQNSKTAAGQDAADSVNADIFKDQLTKDANAQYEDLSEDEKLEKTLDEYVNEYIAGNLDAAVTQAREDARINAEQTYETNLGIGTFHENYTGADGANYTNVFVKEAKSTFNHGHQYSFTAVDVPNFKEAPAVASGILTNNTTVRFLLSNDLFAVNVEHYKENRNGEFSATADFTEYLLVNSGSGYTVSTKDFTDFTLKAEDVTIPGSYTMDAQNPADATYKLHYLADKYTATFSFLGENGPVSTVPLDQNNLWKGDTVIDPNVESLTGWTFDGWYTSDTTLDATTKYDFSTSVTNDVNLYGRWDRKTYTVDFTFTPDDAVPTDLIAPLAQTGIAYEGTATAVDAIDGSSYNTDDISYTFDGWYTNPECLGEKFAFSNQITENVHLYGKWTKEAQSYAYKVEHWNKDTNQLIGTTTEMTPELLEFGTVIDNDSAKSYGYSQDDLKKAFGHEYGELASATGCTIGATEANNVIKCYYQAKSFNLSVNYVYQDQSSAATSHGPVSIQYGKSYNVTSPTITNYTADLTAVIGSMPGNDVSVKVTYTENDKASITVNYLDATTKALIADLYLANGHYVNDPYTLSNEFTTGKEIANYTYASRDGGDDNGTMSKGGITINIYFTRDTANLTIKHVDITGNDEYGMFFGNAQESINTNENYTDIADPETTLPPDYKLISAESTTVDSKGGTITGAATFDNDKSASVLATVKDSKTTITYTYGPKANAYVTVNYKLINSKGDVISTLGTDATSYKEGATYDVTNKILETYGDKKQYSKSKQDGDAVTGTLNAGDAKVIDVYYTTNQYSFTVKYVNDYTKTDIDTIDSTDNMVADYGVTLNNEIIMNALSNNEWITAKLPNGYHLSTIKYPVIDTEAVNNVVEVHYDYTPYTGGGNYDYYKVTVNYLEEDTNTVLSNAYTSNLLLSGSSYDMTTQTAMEINGYSIASVSGDAVEGRMTSDKVINVYYVVSTDITDPDVPLGPNPDPDPDIDITDPDVPLGPNPDIDIEEPETPLSPNPGLDGVDDIIIIDPNVPLGNLPNTGTKGEEQAKKSNGSLSTIAMLISLATAGIIITFSRKKEENEEN